MFATVILGVWQVLSLAAATVLDTPSPPRAAVPVGVWTTHGPASGGASALALDPVDSSIVYARTPRQGLLKSEDGGGHWRPINRTDSAAQFGPFALDVSLSGTIYAFEANDLYRSDDRGGSWAYVSHVPDSGQVELAVVDPTRSATLYAASSRPALSYHGFPQTNLLRSEDSGRTWTLLNGDFSYGFRSFIIHPSNPSILYAAFYGVGSILRSLDGGKSWALFVVVSSAPVSGFDVALDPADPGTIYACTWGGLLRSRDGGNGWTLVVDVLREPNGTPFQILSVRVDPRQSQRIYAGTQYSLFRSDDSGSTWTFLTHQVQGLFAIDPVDSSILYGAPGGKSFDAGATWQPLATGEIATSVSALALSAGSPSALYGVGRAAYRSDDGGLTWTTFRTGLESFDPGLGLSCVAVDPANPSTVFAGRSGYSRTDSPGLFRSTSGGLVWSPFGDGLPDFGVLSLAVARGEPRVMFAGTFDGVYRSDDGGSTWRPSFAGQRVSIEALSIDPADSMRLYAAGNYSPFYRSVDGGSSWTSASLGVSAIVGAIAIDPRSTTTLYVATDRGLLRSLDGGLTWSLIGTSFFGDPMVGPDPWLTALAIHPLRPSNIYVGTRYGQIFRSEDGGASWREYDRGFPQAQITALLFDPRGGVLYAAAEGEGVYTCALEPSRPKTSKLIPR